VVTVMFLSFVGFSVAQFHGYLFQRTGFSPLQIGLLLGMGFTADILAPLFQVAAIRRLRGPRRPLVLVLAGAGLGTVFLPFVHGFAAAALVFSFTLFCSSCINPLNTACTLEVTRTRGQGFYFAVRTVGTVGYLFGCLFSYFLPEPARLPLLYLGFGLSSIIAIPVILRTYIPEDPRQAPEDILVNPRPRRTPGLRRAVRLLSAPVAKRLLWALGVMNFANAMATLVQGNYLVTRFAKGQASISLAWIIATGFEVPLMLACAWLVKRHGLRAVLGFGLLGTTLKLFFLGAADSYGVFLAGLAFHGCFYSGALAGFSLFLDQRYAVADRPSLQALGSLFYAGIPMALGGLAAGVLWHLFDLHTVYLVAALMGLGTGAYTLILMPKLPGKTADRHQVVPSPRPTK
jgi:MFS family permease